MMELEACRGLLSILAASFSQFGGRGGDSCIKRANFQENGINSHSFLYEEQVIRKLPFCLTGTQGDIQHILKHF